jgi:hypothetical protein
MTLAGRDSTRGDSVGSESEGRSLDPCENAPARLIGLSQGYFPGDFSLLMDSVFLLMGSVTAFSLGSRSLKPNSDDQQYKTVGEGDYGRYAVVEFGRKRISHCCAGGYQRKYLERATPVTIAATNEFDYRDIVLSGGIAPAGVSPGARVPAGEVPSSGVPAGTVSEGAAPGVAIDEVVPEVICRRRTGVELLRVTPVPLVMPDESVAELPGLIPGEPAFDGVPEAMPGDAGFEEGSELVGGRVEFGGVPGLIPGGLALEGLAALEGVEVEGVVDIVPGVVPTVEFAAPEFAAPRAAAPVPELPAPPAAPPAPPLTWATATPDPNNATADTSVALTSPRIRHL